jgi:hypothetical protein
VTVAGDTPVSVDGRRSVTGRRCTGSGLDGFVNSQSEIVLNA